VRFFRRSGEARSADIPQSSPSSGVPWAPPVDGELPDGQWFDVCTRRYDDTWREYVGSPETFAEAGRLCYGNGEFGVALLFYQKAIDLLHSLYDWGRFERRQPSPADVAITDGYLNSLGATLSEHPAAPVDESVREVTHRLRTIATASAHAGINPQLYRNALDCLRRTAPTVSLEGVLGEP
jgi:hypothetical protein